MGFAGRVGIIGGGGDFSDFLVPSGAAGSGFAAAPSQINRVKQRESYL
jgi:hypothetical protein